MYIGYLSFENRSWDPLETVVAIKQSRPGKFRIEVLKRIVQGT